MSQNSEFQQACEAWVRSSLSVLTTKPLPRQEDREVIFTPNGYQTRGGVYKVDYVRLYIMHRNDLTNLPTFSNIVDIVARTPALSSVLFKIVEGQVPTAPDIQKGLLERYLNIFLIEYLKSTQDFSFRSTEFENLYGKLEQYIYSETFDSVWLVPLRNLTSEVASCHIDRGVVLRQATHEEKVDAVKSEFTFIPNVFLEIHCPTSRTISPDQEDAITPAQAVVLALRLLKPHPVEISSYQWLVPDQPFFQARVNILLQQHPSAGETYVLTQEDANVLPKLFAKAKRAYASEKLSSLITRYDDSYLRAKLEDKLIDYWIALESLFFSLIKKEFVGSMGETVASTMAFYLGNTQSERQSIYEFVISSHIARGHFVHGQRGEPVKNLELVVRKTEKYLRMALRKRIEETE